ncbi:DUF6003 family protein [Streptomyces shaanxiensis]
MTDDAYLFLLDDASLPLGVAPAAVGELACMENSGRPGVAGRQRPRRPHRTCGCCHRRRTRPFPEGAERLPVPLSDEELSRVRHLAGPGSHADVEEELLAYRDCADGRDDLIGRALAAGVPPHRIVELTGVDPATVTAAAEA